MNTKMKDINNDMNSPASLNVPAKQGSSKGKLFKEKFGYSKTMKRLLKKHGVSSVEEYKGIRKARKKVEAKGRRDHRDKIRAGKKSKTSLKK
jgi:hypothetical protein